MIYIFEVIFSMKILSFQAFYVHRSWQILQDTLKSFINSKRVVHKANQYTAVPPCYRNIEFFDGEKIEVFTVFSHLLVIADSRF